MTKIEVYAPSAGGWFKVILAGSMLMLALIGLMKN